MAFVLAVIDDNKIELFSFLQNSLNFDAYFLGILRLNRLIEGCRRYSCANQRPQQLSLFFVSWLPLHQFGIRAYSVLEQAMIINFYYLMQFWELQGFFCFEIYRVCYLKSFRNFKGFSVLEFVGFVI